MYLIVTPTNVERFDQGSEAFIARLCALKLATRAVACEIADSLAHDFHNTALLRHDYTGEYYHVVYIHEVY